MSPARRELAPQAAGLLAISLRLSRMYRDDLARPAVEMALHDAFRRRCRSATAETNNWPTTAKGGRE